MEADSRLEFLLKRDRAVMLAALAGITLVAWAYMAHEARAMLHTGVCHCFGLKLGGPDLQAWGWSDHLALFLMWAEMMVAMMVPTVAPMVLTFAALSRQRRAQERPYAPAGLFLLGYLVVWTGFSAVAALAQGWLHSRALLSPMMVSTSPVLGGIVLLVTGVFQWTPLKHACLNHCRSPVSFFMTDWREGRRGAFLMGLKHGAYCTGCCWFLMALLFVAGVMNLLWIAVITAFVLLEKVAPNGLRVGQVAGAFLAAWGVWMLVGW